MPGLPVGGHASTRGGDDPALRAVDPSGQTSPDTALAGTSKRPARSKTSNPSQSAEPGSPAAAPHGTSSHAPTAVPLRPATKAPHPARRALRQEHRRQTGAEACHARNARTNRNTGLLLSTSNSSGATSAACCGRGSSTTSTTKPASRSSPKIPPTPRPPLPPPTPSPPPP